ncbi:zinc finger protein 813-like [Teleopsis dalmanni]|uniref:zinc finger protein 813-like n=1 Tax=Teleopsis dalmanni TaxID=139649 RepID=UPI0018CFDAAA|nr:zinc finger protein 813-like [Teleopsis dalmanni]
MVKKIRKKRPKEIHNAKVLNMDEKVGILEPKRARFNEELKIDPSKFAQNAHESVQPCIETSAQTLNFNEINAKLSGLYEAENTDASQSEIALFKNKSQKSYELKLKSQNQLSANNLDIKSVNDSAHAAGNVGSNNIESFFNTSLNGSVLPSDTMCPNENDAKKNTSLATGYKLRSHNKIYKYTNNDSTMKNKSLPIRFNLSLDRKVNATTYVEDTPSCATSSIISNNNNDLVNLKGSSFSSPLAELNISSNHSENQRGNVSYSSALYNNSSTFTGMPTGNNSFIDYLERISNSSTIQHEPTRIKNLLCPPLSPSGNNQVQQNLPSNSVITESSPSIQEAQELMSLIVLNVPIKENFLCKFCDLAFSIEAECKQHENTHDRNKPYGCQFCTLIWRNRRDLIEHIKNNHSKLKANICPLCKKGFNRHSDLKKHTVIHTGVRPYTCGLCRKTFSRDFNLQKHFLLHTGQHPFVCPYCPKCFSNSTKLIQHIQFHSAKNLFECKICNVSFSQQKKFIIHQQIHGDSDVENNKTDVHSVANTSSNASTSVSVDKSVYALKSFYKEINVPVLQNLDTSDYLKKHSQIDSDGFLSCNKCGMTYKCSKKLVRHIIDRHGDANSLAFLKCGETFYEDPSPESILTFVVTHPNLSIKELCMHFNITEEEASENIMTYNP